MKRNVLMTSSLMALFGTAAAFYTLNVPEASAKTWPAVRSPIKKDAAIEANIDEWLAKMSLEQKVGQMIQEWWRVLAN